MIEFTDLNGKKLSLYELGFYSGIGVINIKKLLNNDSGADIETALKIEEMLDGYGYKIPAEVFMSKKTKAALRAYVEKLTEGLFEIRDFNLQNGRINEYNKIKAKSKKLYEEIKRLTLGTLRVPGKYSSIAQSQSKT